MEISKENNKKYKETSRIEKMKEKILIDSSFLNL